MPIKIGSTDINDIFIGANKVDNIFVGSNKVWSRPLLYGVTVGTNIPTAAGVKLHGYADYGNSVTYGSLSLLNNYRWFNNSDPLSINWVEFFNPDSAYYQGVNVVFPNQHANSDSVFKSVTINGTTFERSSADDYRYVNSANSNYTSWEWKTPINPWSGEGNTDRVRFERDV